MFVLSLFVFKLYRTVLHATSKIAKWPVLYLSTIYQCYMYIHNRMFKHWDMFLWLRYTSENSSKYKHVLLHITPCYTGLFHVKMFKPKWIQVINIYWYSNKSLNFVSYCYRVKLVLTVTELNFSYCYIVKLQLLLHS